MRHRPPGEHAADPELYQRLAVTERGIARAIGRLAGESAREIQEQPGG